MSVAPRGFERSDFAAHGAADWRSIQEDPREVICSRGLFAELRDGTWIRIGRSRGGRVRIDGSDGSRWLEHAFAASLITGHAIEMLPPLRLGGKLRTMLRQLLNGNRVQLARVLVTFIVAQAGVIVPPLLTRAALDHGIYGSNASLVQVFTIALAVTSVWYASVMWWRSMVVQICKSAIERLTNRALMRHLFDIPFARTDDLTTGELLQAFFGAQVFRDLTVDRVIAALFDTITVATSIATAALLFPASLAVLVPAAAFIGAVGYLSARMQIRYRRDELRQQAIHRGYLVELLQSIVTVKVAVAEEPLMGRWLTALRSELATAFARQRTALRFDLVTYACVHGSVVAVVCAMALFTLDQSATFGTLVALTQVGAAAVAGAAAATASLVIAAVSAPHMAQTVELAEAPVAVFAVAGSVGAGVAITVDELAFRRTDEGAWVLRNVSFSVPRGAKLRVSGPSGAGKTTLLRILAGLYSPVHGRVALAEGVRRITYVPQRAYVFAGTILQNLRRYSAQAADDLLFAASEQIGLDRWVRTLPLGYATPVGAGGVTLSGGQRQLIALAGALAAEGSIILLDEPSSNLDSESATAVFAAPGWHDRTVVFATHDKHLFSDAVEYRLPSQDPAGSWRPLHA